MYCYNKMLEINNVEIEKFENIINTLAKSAEKGTYQYQNPGTGTGSNSVTTLLVKHN